MASVLDLAVVVVVDDLVVVELVEVVLGVVVLEELEEPDELEEFDEPTLKFTDSLSEWTALASSLSNTVCAW